jgi:hypothetical protein
MMITPKRFRYFVLGALSLVAVLGGNLWAAQSTPSQPAVAQEFPKAVFPETRYEFDAVMEGTKIEHDFVIENHGSAPLEIKNVRPD